MLDNQSEVSTVAHGPSSPVVAYIAGSGRSGSTMLDLLLSSNPAVQGTGEFHRLSVYARDNLEPCTCGCPVALCPFWLKVQDVARARIGRPSGELLKTIDPMLYPAALNKAQSIIQKALICSGSLSLYRMFAGPISAPHVQAAQNSLFWYSCIREATGKQVIVDSSKDARRLFVLYAQRPQEVRVIHLIRDGRAVAASHMRRLGISIEEASRMWFQANRRAMFAMRGVSCEHRLAVRYEDMCASPLNVIRKVCSFLGIPLMESLPVLRKNVSHNIGGNPMRFRKDQQAIVLDEKWKNILTIGELQAFERIGGQLNQSFGYRPVGGTDSP